MWVQRSHSGSIRRAVHVVVGAVAGLASLLLVAPAALAIVLLEAQFGIVGITVVLVTLAGLTS